MGLVYDALREQQQHEQLQLQMQYRHPQHQQQQQHGLGRSRHVRGVTGRAGAGAVDVNANDIALTALVFSP